MMMPFGKYRGQKLDGVPTDYLNWVLQNCTNIRPHLKADIIAVLKFRRVEEAKKTQEAIDAAEPARQQRQAARDRADDSHRRRMKQIQTMLYAGEDPHMERAEKAVCMALSEAGWQDWSSPSLEDAARITNEWIDQQWDRFWAPHGPPEDGAYSFEIASVEYNDDPFDGPPNLSSLTLVLRILGGKYDGRERTHWFYIREAQETIFHHVLDLSPCDEMRGKPIAEQLVKLLPGTVVSGRIADGARKTVLEKIVRMPSWF